MNDHMHLKIINLLHSTFLFKISTEKIVSTFSSSMVPINMSLGYLLILKITFEKKNGQFI